MKLGEKGKGGIRKDKKTEWRERRYLFVCGKGDLALFRWYTIEAVMTRSPTASNISQVVAPHLVQCVSDVGGKRVKARRTCSDWPTANLGMNNT